ncbi:hypothetical protein A2767_03070 [Candidatus Roizmanbacteria bacterium RIFCSPHIGHO2_01_FULL_35_10]|nr:MAG: hypothetical protein A2767_03070 [Candidatus Roizmanbacteria bacterium RIFCSPHIGHO2_01_FULL_35_10]
MIKIHDLCSKKIAIINKIIDIPILEINIISELETKTVIIDAAVKSAKIDEITLKVFANVKVKIINI